MKKLLCLFLCIAFIFSASGCAFLQLNEAKDAESVVATIDGREYTKADFIKYYKVAEIVYNQNGYSLPDNEEDEKAFKETAFEDFVRMCALAAYVEANGIPVEEEEVPAEPAETDADTPDDNGTEPAEEKKTPTEQLIEALKEKYPEEADYNKYLSDIGFKDESSLIEASEYYMDLTAKSNAFYKRSVDHSFLFGEDAFKVGDEKVSDQEFYFYTVMLFIQLYLNYQTFPSTDDEQLPYYDSIKTDYLAKYHSIAQYASEKGITVTDEDIDAQTYVFDYYTAYFGEDTLDTLYSQYFLSEEDVAKAKESAGKAMALSQAYTDYLLDNWQPTADEVSAYYAANPSYFGPFVTARYISFDNLETTSEFWEEIHYDKNRFDVLYKNAENGDVPGAKTGEITDQIKSQISDGILAETVFNMKEGEMTGGVPGSDGNYIVYVESMRDSYNLDDADDYKKIVEIYKENNSSNYTSAQTKAVTDGFTVTDGDYKQTPSMRLNEWIERTYKIRRWEKRALR